MRLQTPARPVNINLSSAFSKYISYNLILPFVQSSRLPFTIKNCAEHAKRLTEIGWKCVCTTHIAIGYLIDHEQMFSFLLPDNNMKNCQFRLLTMDKTSAPRECTVHTHNLEVSEKITSKRHQTQDALKQVNANGEKKRIDTCGPQFLPQLA